MLLSQTSQYALRAALYLAERRDGAPVRVDDIATALGIPRNYLSKILHGMARAGVLVSERGPGGGFRLAADAAELSLAHVLEPLHPDLLERRCLLGRPDCSDRDPCPAHASWRELAERIEEFLDTTTLAGLARVRSRPARVRRRLAARARR